MFYLEHNRLEDALKVFSRMEKLKRVNFHLVGQTGRAIVLALQNRSEESNELFRRACTPTQGKPKLDNWFQMLLQEEHWRIWMRKALYYNRENGVKKEDIPTPLHKFL
jgi:hypothetical protein